MSRYLVHLFVAHNAMVCSGYMWSLNAMDNCKSTNAQTPFGFMGSVICFCGLLGP